jgi:hypothetical protein
MTSKVESTFTGSSLPSKLNEFAIPSLSPDSTCSAATPLADRKLSHSAASASAHDLERIAVTRQQYDGDADRTADVTSLHPKGPQAGRVR